MNLPVYMQSLPICPYGEKINLTTENTEKLIVMKKHRDNIEKSWLAEQHIYGTYYLIVYLK